MISSLADAKTALLSLDFYSPANAGEGCILYGFILRDPRTREQYSITRYKKHFLIIWSLPRSFFFTSSENTLEAAASFVFSNRSFFNNAERFRELIANPHIVADLDKDFRHYYES